MTEEWWVASTEERLQKIMDRSNKTAMSYDMKININKTKATKVKRN